MFKTATLICIGLCLVASQALAGTDTQSGGTVTLASNSGLYVRVASTATYAGPRNSNVCGSAVNTGGIARATIAVKTGGRVFLTGSSGMNVSQMRLAAVTTHGIKVAPVRQSPGLGALLARIFGLAS